jgi:hypothetical protein
MFVLRLAVPASGDAWEHTVAWPTWTKRQASVLPPLAVPLTCTCWFERPDARHGQGRAGRADPGARWGKRRLHAQAIEAKRAAGRVV